MSTYFIPGTTVAAELLQPVPPSTFVSLFLGATETGNGNYSGSVNAGTSNAGSVFAVGLGGINGAFASSLGKAGQNTDAYQGIHDNLFHQAGSGLQAFSSNYTATDPVCFSLLQKPDPSFNLPGYDGIVFIDIFNPAQLPAGNSLNSAMLYVVPPASSNYPDIPSFLAAVKATNITLIKALAAYNSGHAGAGTNLQPIGNIRMCLFSGGIYKGYASADDVAKNNLLGLSSGLTATGITNNAGISLVQFEFDNVKPWLTSN